ncbi:biotin transporter BioY, partial [Archangium sp.]|uniref:biotin transporter BioY n=1 Tax=Archangium sp. TaxID=1872627 RepID=UPI002ED8E1BC
MKTRDLVHVALFAALVAALGLMPPLMLPFIPVPITAQTLGVMLAGSTLGARKAGLSLLLFQVLVLAGLPLLAGGHGGLAVLPGPTGGF